ncbi:MAG TPA: hypothetical protein VF244_10935 [Acidimicrobiales bacterium]
MIANLVLTLAAYARAAGAGPETACQIGEQVAAMNAHRSVATTPPRAILADVERLVAEHRRMA